MNRSPIQVMLYDPDRETRQIICRRIMALSGVALKAESGDIRQAESDALTEQPTVCLLGIDADPDKTLSLAHRLSVQWPDTALLVMGNPDDHKLAQRCMEAGAAELLHRPPTPGELMGAVGRSMSLREQGDGQLWTVLGCAGGLGATTLAINLAERLAKGGSTGSVLLIDFDFMHGDIDVALDLEPESSIEHLALNSRSLNAGALRRAVTKYSQGLRVLAAPSSVLNPDTFDVRMIRRILQTAKQCYSHVVVDLGTALCGTAACVLDMTDELLLMTAADLATLRNTQRACRYLDGVVQSELSIRLILADPPSRGGENLKPRQVVSVLQRELFGSLPYDPPAALAARNRGEALAEAAPASELHRAIEAISINLTRSSAGGKQRRRPA